MEMTVKNFVIFFVLQFLFRSARCCEDLFGGIGNMTTDYDLEVGSTLISNCSLTKHQAKINDKLHYLNSSMLYFKFNQTKITKNVEILDPLTIQLRIENVTEGHKGNYFCFASLPETITFVCNSIYTVGYPPLPVEDFDCVSLEYENLTCSWTLPHNPVKTDYTLQDSVMIYGKRPLFFRDCPEKISKTSCQWTVGGVTPYIKTRSDLYFRLIGNNSLGTNSQLFILDHYSRVLPGIPATFNTTNVTRNTFTAQWSPPEKMSVVDDFKPGLTYQLQYQSQYRMDKPWKVIEVNKTDSLTVTDLVPGTLYSLKLRCRSTVATSEKMWSGFNKTVVDTKPDVPYLAPEVTSALFEVENFLNERKITIYWKAVPQEYSNGKNLHYIVECNQAVTMHRVNGIYVEYQDMRLDSAYSFKITAVNDQGESKNHSIIKVFEKEKLPPAPRDTIARYHGNGKYELTWTMPRSEEFHIVNYTIVYCKTSRPRPFHCKEYIGWKVIPHVSSVEYQHSRIMNHTLELPDSDSNYQFSVSANTESLSSGLEWIKCIVPYNSVGSNIKMMNLQSINSTSIKVTWDLECAAQKHFVSSYIIYYCELSVGKTCKKINEELPYPRPVDTIESNYKRAIVTDRFANSYFLTGLKPYTKYKVSVVIKSNGKESEIGKELMEQTRSAAPSDSPHNVIVRNVTNTTVQLTAEPSLITNGIVTNYVVSVTFDNGFEKKKDYPVDERTGGLSAVINGLTPYTTYFIKVQACVGLACSPPNIINVTTDIGVPGNVESLITDIYNATFVQISWIPPQHPNGRIDFYTLYMQWSEDDKTFNESRTITDHDYFNLSLNCPITENGRMYTFSVQPANVRSNKILYGNFSAPSQTKLCYLNPRGMELGIIIGITIGGAIGLAFLVFVLYLLARWMKKKVDIIKDIKVQLPTGLDSPQGNPLNSYEHFKNGLIRKASEGTLSPRTVYGRLSSYASDDGDSKDQQNSASSQFSNNSTEELIYKKNKSNNDEHQLNGDNNNIGKGHDSISSSLTNRTQLSSDSGAETDLHPLPSPDSDNGVTGLPHSSPQPRNKSPLPKVDEAHSSDSKDSGLEKEEGGNERENDSNHYSRFIRYLDNPHHPYNKRQTTDKNVGSQQLPYSKFGVNMPGVSGYIPLANSLIFMSRSLANSEPSVVDVNKADETDHNIATPMESPAPPYSKYGLARSLGETLNVSASPEISDSGNGYSKFGMTPNIPWLQQSESPYVSNDIAAPVVANPPNQQIPAFSKPTYPTKPPTSRGYVSVDKLINPNGISANQPLNGSLYSRLGVEPAGKKQIPHSDGYVTIQDDMLNGKEKSFYPTESKQQPTAGIPGYSKFDIQCNQLQDLPAVHVMDPALTGTRPKTYPNNNHQSYTPYSGKSLNKSNPIDVNDIVLSDEDDQNSYPVHTNSENDGDVNHSDNVAKVAPSKYLSHPKVYSPTGLSNGYVRVTDSLNSDLVRIVPNENPTISSLTDTAV